MKPKAQGPHDEGFLEYLEDIIGTNKYVEKIDESSKQWVLHNHIPACYIDFLFLSNTSSILVGSFLIKLITYKKKNDAL